MKIIKKKKIFDLHNHGDVYECTMGNGQHWVMSVSGKWVQIKKSKDLTIDELQKSFEMFQKSGEVFKETDIIVDNASQISN